MTTPTYSPPSPAYMDMTESIDGRIRDIITRIKYKDWALAFHSPLDSSRYVQVFIPHPDGPLHPTDRNNQGYWSSRKWLLSPHMTDSEIILTCFKAIITAEEHETREAFLFDGVAVLGPHWDLITLSKLIKDGVINESIRK